jgi:hypothetical protein
MWPWPDALLSDEDWEMAWFRKEITGAIAESLAKGWSVSFEEVVKGMTSLHIEYDREEREIGLRGGVAVRRSVLVFREPSTSTSQLS